MKTVTIRISPDGKGWLLTSNFMLRLKVDDEQMTIYPWDTVKYTPKWKNTDPILTEITLGPYT